MQVEGIGRVILPLHGVGALYWFWRTHNRRKMPATAGPALAAPTV